MSFPVSLAMPLAPETPVITTFFLEVDKRFGLDFKPALDAPDKAIELAKKELSNEELENFRLIYLKDSLAGVMRINHIQVKELFLHEDFQDQNLSIEIIESYYFY